MLAYSMPSSSRGAAGTSGLRSRAAGAAGAATPTASAGRGPGAGGADGEPPALREAAQLADRRAGPDRPAGGGDVVGDQLRERAEAARQGGEDGAGVLGRGFPDALGGVEQRAVGARGGGDRRHRRVEGEPFDEPGVHAAEQGLDEAVEDRK